MAESAYFDAGHHEETFSFPVGLMQEGGPDRDHGPEPDAHYEENNVEDQNRPAKGMKGLMRTCMAYIPDELVVVASFGAVFAICLAAMLPWYYASRGLINSSTVSTANVENGMSFTGSLKSVDPLALQAGLILSSTFVGCTNIGYYTSEPNSTLPQIDDALDLFYMDSNCLYQMTGQNWSFINNQYSSSDPEALAASITIMGQRLYYVYNPFDQASSDNATLRLQEVNPYQNYPFDIYTAQLIVSSFLSVNGTICVNGSSVYYTDTVGFYCSNAAGEVAGAQAVSGDFQTPVMATLQSTVVGFTVSFRIVQAIANIQNSTSFIIYMDISRSSFTQGLSMFIVCVMWGISLGITVLALDSTYFRHHKPVPLGMAGLCATMLFALPSLRSVQPGIPPTALYASIDIFSFFMNMALIGCSLVLLLIKIIAENKAPDHTSTPRSRGPASFSAPLSSKQGQPMDLPNIAIVSNPLAQARGYVIQEEPGSRVMSMPRQVDTPKPSSATIRVSSIAGYGNNNAEL